MVKKAKAAKPSRQAATKPAKAGKAANGTKAAKTAKPAGNSKPAPASSASLSFPVVGIGASAGGLEALEQFLTHVPAGSGMAFVIVQHLDPSRKGALPQLLQRLTPMPVQQAEDRMRVQPDHVYVIPPNKDLAMRDGILHLSAPEVPRGLRLPVDSFFRSLAADREQFAIGVILSGMGSDGSLGLRAVKDNAGLALVQDPASAKFDGMPRSAIDAGCADIIAPADELPGRIRAYLEHAPIVHAQGEAEAQAHSALDKILLLLRVQTGHDFSLYKKSTLYRRIERRMGIHQIDRIAAYARFLRENPQEVDLLFKELLIGVTNFFRDPEAWDMLRDHVLPELLASSQSAGRNLRAWVTGCSTGEEAYSLAIVFKEALEKAKPQGRFSLQIYATDLDHTAIEKARQGAYPNNIAADVSPERLARFFIASENGYLVGKEVREMVIFAPQNVIMDPPFTKLDILCCRNLLIYLGPELQKKLLPLFHYSLNPGGTLFLGSAETIGGFTDLFSPLDAKSRLYRRSLASQRLGDVEFPTRLPLGVTAPPDDAKQPAVVNLQAVADQLLLRSYAPAAVFMNAKGDIVYINGRTGKYLEPAAGKANWNIFAMARDGLRHELASAMQRARQQGEPVTVSGIKLEGNGQPHYVSLTVEALDEPQSLSGMLVAVFRDETPPLRHAGRRGAAGGNLMVLEEEVQNLREQLQTTREEMQSSQEELKSANEELQSTNEELTTSKEEMQSLNEELQTVNAELQSKVEDLSRASNDMKNLLNSTDIAIVFLDNALHVRRFTNSATRIIKLIPGDVGRPLTDIVSELDYPQLHEDAKEVLRTLVFSEKEVATRDGGSWFLVRIMPYRTSENVIDGVVITFVDVTRAKSMEVQLREALRQRGAAG